MQPKQALLSLLLLLACGSLPAKTARTNARIERQADGLQVAITFYSPSIVRVTKTVPGGPGAKASYSVIKQPEAVEGFQTHDTPAGVEAASPLIKVSLDTLTGELTFSDSKGNRLLTDTRTTLEARTDKANAGKYRIRQRFLLDKDEAVYGLGQLRDTHMSQRGRHVEIWNHNTYISIPYVTSDKGYGLYWDNAGKSFFDDTPDSTTFTSEVGTAADYYFIYRDGTQDGVVDGIRDLTGQATMFPLWAMGFWQCRERYKTSDELAAVLDRYRELRIPTDAIVQDWQYWGCDSNWNAMRFMNPYYINKVGDPAWNKYLPNDMRGMAQQGTPRLKSPQEMVGYVHDHHARLMITIWANFGPWTAQYGELKKIGALYPFDTWPQNSGVMPYDAFNPKARDIYWKHLSHLYAMGFDAWWTDSTEPDHFEKAGDDDWQTHDGSWLSVKNAFPLLHNKGIYEHQRKMKGNHKRSLQMTRSGAFGLQHYGSFSWSGDIQASWDEMKAQIPSGLNYTLCGIPFWNTDLGGFFYWGYNNDPKNPALQELQTRWMQWGTFMPLMRNHCSSPMVSELYEMGLPGDWAYDAILEAIKLRYRLLPYIYSTMADCVQRSGSMMRALVMDFATDKKASRIGDEYLFGRNILVKPVTDPLYTWKDKNNNGHLIYPDPRKAAAPVTTYLPQGATWFDFWDNSVHEGGQDVTRPCPIDIMPVYVKAGTILPFGPDVQYSDEKPWDDLEIRVYPGADGAFTLYEDEGDNYNYEKGQFSEIRMSWDDAGRRLTIGQRRGAFKGMATSRTFRIVLVGKDSGGKGSEPMKTTVSTPYDGHEISILL